MKKGISTIIATIILTVITIGLVSTAYLYFAGLIGGYTKGGISLVDGYCAPAGNIIFIVKNEGTETIAAGGVSCNINGVACVDGGASSCGAGISYGGTCSYNISNTIDPGVNQVRVVAANAVGGPITCG